MTVFSITMATPSGSPPNQTPTATTNSTSGDKKKLFIGLGVAGVAALGLGGYFLMNSGSGGATDAATNAATANSAQTSVAPGGALDAAGGASGSTLANGGIPPAGSGAGVTQVSTSGNPATLWPLSPYRRDPFQPFVIPPPPPTPVPPPPPAPPRPTPIPPPVPIPEIDSDLVNVPTVGGGFAGSGGSGTGSLVLPSVVIPRLNGTRTTPTNAFPPPRSSSGAGSGVTSPSFDKRLSGVIIGNGVRAVLEINNGTTTKSYVVQPGDVVDGITILNIQRYSEGGQQVTRMLIRENGGERTVDLKPGPPRTGVGGEGIGGFPGGPGGIAGAFGGRPGGFGGG